MLHCSGSVKGHELVPHLNSLPFFRQRIQARAAANQPSGATSYGMGWLVKDALQAFCTSSNDAVEVAHLPSHRWGCGGSLGPRLRVALRVAVVMCLQRHMCSLSGVANIQAVQVLRLACSGNTLSTLLATPLQSAFAW